MSGEQVRLGDGVVRIGQKRVGRTGGFGIGEQLLGGVLPIGDGLRGGVGGECSGAALGAKLHDGPERDGAGIGGFQRKGFLQPEGKVGVVLHQRLKQILVYPHDGDLAGNAELSVRAGHIFAGKNLFGLVGKLLVVLEALRGVGVILLEGLLALVGGKHLDLAADKAH